MCAADCRDCAGRWWRVANIRAVTADPQSTRNSQLARAANIPCPENSSSNNNNSHASLSNQPERYNNTECRCSSHFLSLHIHNIPYARRPQRRKSISLPGGDGGRCREYWKSACSACGTAIQPYYPLISQQNDNNIHAAQPTRTSHIDSGHCTAGHPTTTTHTHAHTQRRLEARAHSQHTYTDAQMHTTDGVRCGCRLPMCLDLRLAAPFQRLIFHRPSSVDDRCHLGSQRASPTRHKIQEKHKKAAYRK